MKGNLSNIQLRIYNDPRKPVANDFIIIHNLVNEPLLSEVAQLIESRQNDQALLEKKVDFIVNNYQKRWPLKLMKIGGNQSDNLTSPNALESI
jgi:hypothetical protein